MANLRVDKITSTETFETTGSVQFDGSGDYLDLGTSSDFTASGDFTVEGWVYHKTGSGITQLFGLGDYKLSSGFVIYVNANRRLSFYTDNDQLDSDTYVDDKTWSHLAVVRSGSKISLYLNGSRYISYTGYSSEFSGRVLIGSAVYNGNPFSSSHGNLSNVRYVVGTALYTSNFKPSMRELEVIPGTVVLACQSKTDASLEKTSRTITVNGNAVASEFTPGLLTPVPKAGAGSAITGSVEFVGDPEHLTVGSASDFAFGTGDFTIETWVNFQDTSTSGLNRRIFSLDASGNASDNLQIIVDEGGATLDGSVFVFSNSILLNANTVINEGAWHHIAVARSGSTIKLFVDGTEKASASNSVSYSPNSGSPRPVIGAQNDTGYYNGFISNLRVVKGTALYTDDFIPPTRELKKVPGTVLLCCQDSNDPTQEATGKTISLNGLFDTSDVVSSGITTTPVSRNFTPQVGDDRKVTFEGVTKINSDAYFYLPTGDTVTRDTRSGRGIFGGGESPSRTDAINFIQIQSMGNAQDFGDLTGARSLLSACASSTRGIFGGGYLAPPSTYLNVMEFVTIASTGDALDFGDLSVDRQGPGSCSNSTRGVFAGGSDPGNLNTIDFVTIASTGDATDFGDLITKRAKHKGCGSSIRAIIFSPEPGEDIQFFNYASTGRATSFGEMTPDTKGDSGVASDSTRALRFGGNTHPAGDIGNNISYITISSTGNEQEFGDLSETSVRGTAMSNSIRAVQILNNDGGNTNAMDYVTIQSTGNGKDFGDLNTANLSLAGSTSDSHGGLG